MARQPLTLPPPISPRNSLRYRISRYGHNSLTDNGRKLEERRIHSNPFDTSLKKSSLSLLSLPNSNIEIINLVDRKSFESSFYESPFSSVITVIVKGI